MTKIVPSVRDISMYRYANWYCWISTRYKNKIYLLIRYVAKQLLLLGSGLIYSG